MTSNTTTNPDVTPTAPQPPMQLQMQPQPQVTLTPITNGKTLHHAPVVPIPSPQIQHLAQRQMENMTPVMKQYKEQYKEYQMQQQQQLNMQALSGHPQDEQRDPSDLDNTNLYVKGLWKDCTQIELDDLFKQFGVISQSRVYGDGVGFVRFEKGHEAKDALEQMNGAKLERCQDPLLVKYAFRKQKSSKRYIRVGDEVKQYEVEMIMNKNTNNVYLRCLPRNYTEQKLTQLCTPYGELTCTRLRESGVAFVRFRRAEDAQKAIRGLNGRRFENHNETLLAKLANSDPFQPKIDFKQRNEEKEMAAAASQQSNEINSSQYSATNTSHTGGPRQQQQQQQPPSQQPQPPQQPSYSNSTSHHTHHHPSEQQHHYQQPPYNPPQNHHNAYEQPPHQPPQHGPPQPPQQHYGAPQGQNPYERIGPPGPQGPQQHQYPPLQQPPPNAYIQPGPYGHPPPYEPHPNHVGYPPYPPQGAYPPQYYEQPPQGAYPPNAPPQQPPPQQPAVQLPYAVQPVPYYTYYGGYGGYPQYVVHAPQQQPPPQQGQPPPPPPPPPQQQQQQQQQVQAVQVSQQPPVIVSPPQSGTQVSQIQPAVHPSLTGAPVYVPQPGAKVVSQVVPSKIVNPTANNKVNATSVVSVTSANSALTANAMVYEPDITPPPDVGGMSELSFRHQGKLDLSMTGLKIQAVAPVIVTAQPNIAIPSTPTLPELQQMGNKQPIPLQIVDEIADKVGEQDGKEVESQDVVPGLPSDSNNNNNNNTNGDTLGPLEKMEKKKSNPHNVPKHFANKLHEVISTWYPSQAGKLTGMFLQNHDTEKVIKYLGRQDRLRKKIDAFVSLLKDN